MIDSLHSKDKNSLFVDPLLDEDEQVGAISIDFRLGYDFQVSILTRKPSVDLVSTDQDWRPVSTYFQETRRDIGEKFVLYPHQVAISTTLEYVALPSDTYADILSRSSYTRLGIHISTMIQPGYKGCIPLELVNHGSTPIELVVGCRIAQARFYKLTEAQEYLRSGSVRKYHGEVRPTISKAESDPDLKKLIMLSRT
ncbi:deoxycytidine triphosphate deaminase [Micavibrio aeruginosavorus EPB]|uniref:Deoxycytidine triphosphate deaminase n=1 Tax=Micavibrio aeruginosavorus EPB TaxID=349215 RepID=M4VKY8_9BACT|nr:deoxycytidine triphosphate deaminase [Micavibrio aeruginosavorus EPB]